jgi:hypothetical protein
VSGQHRQAGIANNALLEHSFITANVCNWDFAVNEYQRQKPWRQGFQP